MVEFALTASTTLASVLERETGFVDFERSCNVLDSLFLQHFAVVATQFGLFDHLSFFSALFVNRVVRAKATALSLFPRLQGLAMSSSAYTTTTATTTSTSSSSPSSSSTSRFVIHCLEQNSG